MVSGGVKSFIVRSRERDLARLKSAREMASATVFSYPGTWRTRMSMQAPTHIVTAF